MSESPTGADGMPVPHATALKRFGPYYLVQKLARGGMAEIFLAKRLGVEGFEKNVVIKRMLPHMSEDPDFVTMFLDEARLAAKLIHPNIAQVSDFGIVDGCYFIGMEYLPGEDLATVIRRCRETNQKVPVDVAIEIALNVCEGLTYAHELEEAGQKLCIVHRDVSPSNVMLSYQGVVKLVDFGIAKATTKLNETRDGKLKGKAVYMSPEQVRGQDLDARADLFSLGLVLHELLTHQRIFKRDGELAVLRAILNDPVPCPLQFRPDLPPELDAVIMKALARDREERFASAAEMRGALESCVAVAPGGSEARRLANFVTTLFGRERMQLKTRIPSLMELDRSAAAATGIITPASLAVLQDMGSGHTPPPGPVAAGETSQTRDLHGSVEPAQSELRHPSRRGRRTWPLVAALIPVILAASAGGAFLVTAMRPRVVVVPAPAPAPASVQPPAPVAVPPPVGEPPRPLDPPVPAEPAAALEPPVVVEPSARRVKVRHDTAPVPLTPKAIAAVIGGGRSKLLACFEKNRAALRSDEGQITLGLLIEKGGDVREAQVTIPGVESSPLSTCIIRQVKGLRFPRHTDNAVRVNVPFMYRVTAK